MPSEQQEEQGADGAAEEHVVRKAIGLSKRLDQLKLEIKPVEDELKSLQPQLVSWFEDHGAQRHTADGKTAYLRRELWVYPAKDKDGKPVDKEAVMEALKSGDLADFVKEAYNVQSISAFARELEKEVDWEESGALLEDAEHPFLVAHPELKGIMEPTEKFEVRIIQG